MLNNITNIPPNTLTSTPPNTPPNISLDRMKSTTIINTIPNTIINTIVNYISYISHTYLVNIGLTIAHGGIMNHPANFAVDAPTNTMFNIIHGSTINLVINNLDNII